MGLEGEPVYNANKEVAVLKISWSEKSKGEERWTEDTTGRDWSNV